MVLVTNVGRVADQSVELFRRSKLEEVTYVNLSFVAGSAQDVRRALSGRGVDFNAVKLLTDQGLGRSKPLESLPRLDQEARLAAGGFHNPVVRTSDPPTRKVSTDLRRRKERAPGFPQCRRVHRTRIPVFLFCTHTAAVGQRQPSRFRCDSSTPRGSASYH